MAERTKGRVLAAGALALAGGALAAATPEGFVQPRDEEGRFLNLDGQGPRGFSAVLRWKAWDGWILGRNRKAPDRAPVPRVEPDWEAIRKPPGAGEGARLTWIGHATWLVQLDGRSFLTDPVLGDSIAGFISRNVPPAIPFERLPRIDAALVSHNHYDHLDLPTLERLGAPVVAGLGVSSLLKRKKLFGTDLGWWQSTEVGGVRITFVPAQHFSQRGLGDRNETLWGGFVIEGSSATVYHAGDTAWFPGFRQIGERFAIDAALLPIGAYDPRWFMKAAHVDPEEALQAFEELGAGTFLAMHWGTFKLADEPLDEPPRLLEEARARRGLPRERVRVPAMGETWVGGRWGGRRGRGRPPSTGAARAARIRVPMNPSAPITPDVVAQHGLKPDEYQRIVGHLGREPNLTELGVFSVMWSEHCSYKSSRVHLKNFPTSGPRVLQGPGENAGVVDVGDGLAVAFKMESHNHPSYIEPYQGAATGVGGILRDVFTMGARPIASMNSLRFGDPSHPKTAWLLEGVVAGIGGYGNCIGVPTVGGEVAFHESYDGNCLVNAFTLGILPADKIFLGKAAGVGNPLMYIGAKTGRDGIHGATMASAEFDEKTEEKRPTVQVGDPFMEKLLLEACLELFQTDAVVGIQDMGAAGLTSSSVEMAGRAGNGLDLYVDQVPRREEGMSPYEVLLSESQERMLLVAARGKEEEVRRICQRWDLDVAVVGVVTGTGRWRVLSQGEVVCDLPVDPLTEGAPRYERPMTPHPALPGLHAFDPRTLPEPADLGDALLTLLARPTIASKEWVYRQYDHMVRLVGAVRPGGDAAVVRIATGNEAHAKKGIALSLAANSRFCFLDPHLGAMHAVAECARNIACVGGEGLAITDCLNFGNPEKPEIMWQLAEAVRGISDACRALGTPVVSGNVSLYNETEGRGIFPTPTVAMVGLVEPVDRTCSSPFKQAGDLVVLVGALTGEVGGSEYLAAIHGKEAGRVPALDLAREKAVQATVRNAVREGLLSSAHDCSEGGLAVALAECCMMAQAPSGAGEPAWLGAALRVPFGQRKDFVLFGEEPARIVVSLSHAALPRLEALAREQGAPLVQLGAVGGDRLEIQGALSVPVKDLGAAWRSGIPQVLQRGRKAG